MDVNSCNAIVLSLAMRHIAVKPEMQSIKHKRQRALDLRSLCGSSVDCMYLIGFSITVLRGI